MSATSFLITGVSIIYPTVCSGADLRKRQSAMLQAFVRRPVTRRMFSFDDVIMTADAFVPADHKQTWHWLCRCLSFIKNGFSYLRRLSFEEWYTKNVNIF